MRYQTKSNAITSAAIASARGSTGSPAGMNVGKSATKKTASFGFAALVRNASPTIRRSLTASASRREPRSA